MNLKNNFFGNFQPIWKQPDNVRSSNTQSSTVNETQSYWQPQNSDLMRNELCVASPRPHAKCIKCQLLPSRNFLTAAVDRVMKFFYT